MNNVINLKNTLFIKYKRKEYFYVQHYKSYIKK